MDESPFKQSDIKQTEKQTKSIKLQKSVVSKFKELLIRFIPFISDLHPDYVFPVALVVALTMSIIFVAIFVTNYNTSLDMEFLSPITDSTTSSDYCDSISSTNTGEYMATQNGFWEGSPGFQYAQSAYIASITSFDTTYSQYSFLMNEIYITLQGLGAIAESQDLAQNLVYWMSVVFTVPLYNAQRFYLTGTPLTVFNRQNTGGSISSVLGDCNVTSTASFDASNGQLILNYNYLDFINDPVCNATVPQPANLGYTPGINSQHFTIKFDVRTLITSLAINLDITYLDYMVEIPGFAGQYQFNGTSYNISSYYDPKYPGMTPLTCINAPVAQCILSVGNSYALPVFNHAGANKTSPVFCDCSELSADYLSSEYSPCNVFSFLSGFLFYDSLNPNELIELAMKYNYNYASINRGAFNASFIGSYWGQQSPDREALNSPANREGAFEFCTLPDAGPCSLVVFSSFDTVINNWAISGYYYQLQTGACRNTFTTTGQYWQDLITTPFAPLTQQYQQCKNSPNVVFMQVAGITMGNVYLLLPFAALLAVGLFHTLKTCRSGYHDRLYSEYEVKEALRALSTSLLLARDDKIPLRSEQSRNIITSSGGSSRVQSLIASLSAELVEVTEAVNAQQRSDQERSAGTGAGGNAGNASAVGQSSSSSNGSSLEAGLVAGDHLAGSDYNTATSHTTDRNSIGSGIGIGNSIGNSSRGTTGSDAVSPIHHKQ